MNLSKPLLLLAVFSLILFGTACKKEDLNKMPIADAGPSQTVTLPTESITLSGSGKDADGKIVTYLWEQTSGPSASVIVDPGAPSTVVQGLIQGTYIFQLSVFDNLGGIGTDTTVIVVKSSAAKTLVLQPDSNAYEFSINLINGADATGLTIASLEATAWTTSGLLTFTRGLVKFDLSSIPSSATIKSAHLFLYSNPSPTTGTRVDANYGDNSFIIQQVSDNWSTLGLSWSNQPAVLTSNQIIVPTTNQPRLDLDVDVTAQVTSMINNNANYGFLLKLQNEVHYASRIFVGSHNPTYPDKHPKLIVEYE